MKHLALLAFFVGFFFACSVGATGDILPKGSSWLQEISKLPWSTAWKKAKNKAAKHVYFDHLKTIYCRCPIKFKEDSDDGAGVPHFGKCSGFDPLDKHVDRICRIEWEHIVPKSFIPKSGLAGKLDLHNLAPSVGQVNAYRSNDKYGEVLDDKNVMSWGTCDARDQGGTSRNGLFEPPDHVKGDVARIWLYMRDTYGVEISEKECGMFVNWSKGDPVSAWEKVRNERINQIQKMSNLYVTGLKSIDSACGP